MKKINYGHWTGYNLLPTGSERTTSPDIVSIVHKFKCKTFYLKLIVPLLRIIRSQKDSVISRTESLKLYYAAALKPGTKNWFPEQLSSKWRRRTIPWGLKWTLMAPRERQFAPQGHKMHGFVKLQPFLPYKKYRERNELRPLNRLWLTVNRCRRHK